jgi:protein Mpv17
MTSAAAAKLLKTGFLQFRTKYNVWTHEQPVFSQVVTAGTLYCVGDVISQKIEGKEHFDYWRCARMTSMGVVLMGFAGGKWYTFIDRRLPDTSNRTIAKKVVFDQFLFAPAFYLCFYFGMSVLEGHTVSQSVDHIKKKFVPTYLADLTFWPVAQTINFKYVSPPNRILYISSLSIGWNAFLSHLQHNDIDFHAILPSFLSPHSKSLPSSSTTNGTSTTQKSKEFTATPATAHTSSTPAAVAASTVVTAARKDISTN